MASVTSTYYVDDVTEERIADDEVEAIIWALDGRAYRSYLTPERRAKFRDMLSEFADAAEIISIEELLPRGRRRSTSGAATSRTRPDREQSQAMRDWGRRNGWEVSDRGRLPEGLAEAYHKSSSSEVASA